MSNTITSEELTKIQEMNTRFTKAKLTLGDLELTKHEMFREIDSLKLEFDENERQLIAKYGADTVINIKTGEVTHKK